MKYILLLIFTSWLHAQDTDTTQTPVMRAYNDFVNYTPKALRNQPVPVFMGDWKPDNLSTLRLMYGYKDSLNPTDGQLSWLKERIDDLAVALFLEHKPVLIYNTGGYSGCPESEYELKKELISGKEVTIVNFCNTCTGGPPGEKEFIAIFNNRTRKLIEAPVNN